MIGYKLNKVLFYIIIFLRSKVFKSLVSTCFTTRASGFMALFGLIRDLCNYNWVQRWAQ